MVLDPRKRQKKLERRKAKDKARHKALATRNPRDMVMRFRGAAAAPVLHCCMIAELWEIGIGNVLISRQLDSGSVAFVMFLVDVYCLGVKDVFYDILPHAAYEDHIHQKLLARGRVVQLKPECCRKLVEGAVAFAQSFGLPPHADYAKAQPIFADLDAGQCDQEFTYGRDGKPFFVAGPYDSPERCRRILHRLGQAVGQGKYDYLIGFPGGKLGLLGDHVLHIERDEAPE